ncbi:MAG: MBL fold metallo-hydrolase [Planctomycetota bacterium]|nr:MBL fold metallo-hydrolase [Planctomycetota bacterium]
MARRQEQESARREISEVGPGILRMELPIRMPGLGHVNMYALVDDEGAAVVDPGMPGPATWKAIVDRLRQADLKVKDVHTVVVTHSHPDHFGGAARLAREAGAKVVAHRSFRFGPLGPGADDAAEVSVDDLAAQRDGDGGGDAASDEGARKAQSNAMRKWSGTTPWGGKSPRPPLRVRLKWRAARFFGGAFVPEINRLVSHGDVLRLAGREFFVMHTPGHTEDHICLHDPEEKIFLAGDHVLPSITPHISGLTHAPDPLDSFFESLDLVAATPDVKQVLPAHGHPFSDLKERAEAIKRHHDERLEKVKGIGRALGPSTVEAFSQKLFHPRSWGSMAESETFAHLEHLLHAGKAERSSGPDGVFLYETG